MLCLDEKGRKSDNVIQACDENGRMYNTLVTFAEDGIMVDGIPTEGFPETIFERTGMYSRTPMGGTRYSYMNDVAYEVIHQMLGNGKTYYLMQDIYNGELVVCYEDRMNYDSYEGYYLVAETAVSYYEQVLMGFTYVQLIDAKLYSEEELFDYGSNGGADFVDRTDECYFPEYFDRALYCEEWDMWLLQAKESGTPFEVTGADTLLIEDGVLQFVGRIKNTGSRKNTLIGGVILYDRYGDEIETYSAISAVLAEDYYIDMDHEGRIRGIESLGVGAGEEAQLVLMDGNEEYMLGAIDLSEFSDEVKYIQVVMLQWGEWSVAMDKLMEDLDN